MESSKDIQELSAIYMRDVAEALNPKLQAIQDKAQADVKKRAAAAAANKANSAKSASDFQAHKKAVIAKGGRPVDALDSWQKKKLNKEENVLSPGQKESGKWQEQVAILRGLVEKTKEKYKTVAAVIDYDRSKKGTDDATYDTEHGEDEKAKKERDYAEWEREKMKKDDPNWKHKKYSTSEMQSYSDAYQKIYEEPIQGEGTKGEVKKELKDLKKAAETGKGKDVKKADAVAEVGEGYQRNPEAGEKKERAAAKKDEAIPGQARRRMPPRGNPDREEFEKWYAANVR